jgi:tRNA dimethylallyltransferase
MTGRIWLIAGPTASGKSALALKLAVETGAEIVNADALQLYADLRILSARPSDEEVAQAPHHLFGTVDAAEGWSVGRWRTHAVEILREISRRDRNAILVGGTGLYFEALTVGLADIPAVAPALRAATAAEFEAMGEPAFRTRLAAKDPAAAQRIAQGDRQRLTRAWDVWAASGVSLTEHQAKTRPSLEPGTWRAVALEPPRETLYARCDARLEAMIEAGVLDEVRALAARNLDPALPAMKAVGMREFASHLSGQMSLADALAAAQRETRRYAKRQTTWMRGRMADWPRLTEIDPEGRWRQFLALDPA